MSSAIYERDVCWRNDWPEQLICALRRHHVRGASHRRRNKLLPPLDAGGDGTWLSPQVGEVGPTHPWGIGVARGDLRVVEWWSPVRRGVDWPPPERIIRRIAPQIRTEPNDGGVCWLSTQDWQQSQCKLVRYSRVVLLQP